MTGKVLTFYLGGSLCGIDIALAKEINRTIKYTSVPGGAAHIVGLLNLRGNVVTLFDLAQILSFPEKEDRLGAKCIILREIFNRDQVGFFIDKLGEVMDVIPDMCELPPANIRNSAGQFIAEVVKCNTQVVLILDMKKIVDIV